jgi:hypothetical protein
MVITFLGQEFLPLYSLQQGEQRQQTCFLVPALIRPCKLKKKKEEMHKHTIKPRLIYRMRE